MTIVLTLFIVNFKFKSINKTVTSDIPYMNPNFMIDKSKFIIKQYA